MLQTDKKTLKTIDMFNDKYSQHTINIHTVSGNPFISGKVTSRYNL